MQRAFYLVGRGWVLIAPALVIRAARPDLYPPGEPISELPGGPPAHLRMFVEQFGIEDGLRANGHEILRRSGDER